MMSVTQYLLQMEPPETAQSLQRSWIVCCKFSPDGKRLAVLADNCIFRTDVTCEPPERIAGCCLRAPDNCIFSVQLMYSVDSQQIIARARTPWDNVDRGNENGLNTI